MLVIHPLLVHLKVMLEEVVQHFKDTHTVVVLAVVRVLQVQMPVLLLVVLAELELLQQ